MSITTERIIGGYLAPIAIMVGALIFGQHTNGYLPAFLAPVLLVVAIAGTAAYRRGEPAYHPRTLWKSL